VAEESKWPENSESTYHTGFWFGSIVKIHVKIWGDFSENGVYYHPPTLPNFATFYRDNDDESDLEVFPWILQTNPNSCCCIRWLALRPYRTQDKPKDDQRSCAFFGGYSSIFGNRVGVKAMCLKACA
jgi:hypothetical protein